MANPHSSRTMATLDLNWRGLPDYQPRIVAQIMLEEWRTRFAHLEGGGMVRGVISASHEHIFDLEREEFIERYIVPELRAAREVFGFGSDRLEPFCEARMRPPPGVRGPDKAHLQFRGWECSVYTAIVAAHKFCAWRFILGRAGTPAKPWLRSVYQPGVAVEA